MAETEELYYSLNNTDNFILADRLGSMQEMVDNHNRLTNEEFLDMIAIRTIKC